MARIPFKLRSQGSSFKMIGSSPMARNFGIGSPLKKDNKPELPTAQSDKTAVAKPKSDIRVEEDYWSAKNPNSGFDVGYHPAEQGGDLPMNYTQESYEEDALYHSRKKGRQSQNAHNAAVRMAKWRKQGSKTAMPKL